MTARERIDYLVDDGTFNEVDPFASTGHNSAWSRSASPTRSSSGKGIIDEESSQFAHDFTVLGGSVGEVVADKFAGDGPRDRARVPVIDLNDSGGSRIQETVVSLVGI